MESTVHVCDYPQARHQSFATFATSGYSSNHAGDLEPPHGEIFTDITSPHVAELHRQLSIEHERLLSKRDEWYQNIIRSLHAQLHVRLGSSESVDLATRKVHFETLEGSLAMQARQDQVFEGSVGTQVSSGLLSCSVVSSSMDNSYNRFDSNSQFNLYVEWEKDLDQSNTTDMKKQTEKLRRQESFLANLPLPDSLLERSLTLLERSPYVISPHSITWVTWLSLGAAVLGYDLFTIPMQVLSIPSSTVTQVASYIILIYWTLDIFAAFSVGYYTPDGELVMVRQQIARHYMRTWCFFDCLVIVPDWISVGCLLTGREDPPILQALGFARASKMVRVIRIFRVLRLRKLQSFAQLIQEHVSSEYFLVLLSFGRNISAILILNHLLACLWYWLGTSDSAWVQAYGFADRNWGDCYLISLQHVLSQFTPGSSPVNPQTNAERVFSIVALVFALVFFSVFVGSTTSQLMRIVSLTTGHKSQIILLRKYLSQRRISRDLGARIQRYIEVARGSTQHTVDRQELQILQLLSKNLRDELDAHVRVRTIVLHPFFKLFFRRSSVLIRNVCLCAVTENQAAVQDVIFTTGEASQAMYFVETGLLMYTPWRIAGVGTSVKLSSVESIQEESILGSGHWCAEASLWTPWFHRGSMRADSITVVIEINSSKFRETVTRNCIATWFTRKYATEFVKIMNASGREILTDIQDSTLHERGIARILSWQRRQAHRYFDDSDIPGASEQNAESDTIGHTYVDVSEPGNFENNHRHCAGTNSVSAHCKHTVL